MKNKIIGLSIIFIMSFSANVIAEPLDVYENPKINAAYTELYELQQEAIELINIAENDITVSELESTIDSVTETLENNEELTVEKLKVLEADLQSEVNIVEMNYEQELNESDDNPNNIPTETVNTAELEEQITEAKNTLQQINEEDTTQLETVLTEANNLLEAEPNQAEVDEMVGLLDEAIDKALTVEDNRSEKVIDNLITVVTKNDYDRAEADRMIQRLQSISPKLYEGLIHSGVKMYLVNFPITELEQFANLAGEVPEGWENEGKTWDDVPGAGGVNSVARIGYSEPNQGNGHGSFNLELHEIAHPIDQIVLNNISGTQEFVDIHQAEQPNFLPDSYFSVPSEYFAEAFSYYFLNENSRNQLRILAPRTYTFIQKISGEEQPDAPSIENLVQAIEEVRAMNDNAITQDLYEAFEFALIVRDNPASTQEEINAAEQRLRDAIQFIQEKDDAVEEDEEETAEEEPSPVNKNELNETIEEAVNIVEETSEQKFIDALNNAYGVSKNPHSTQDEIDVAKDNLASEIAIVQSDKESDSPREDEDSVEDAVIDNINNDANSDSDSDAFVIGSNNDQAIPSTSTHVFNYLFIGLTLIILGITAILCRKLQKINNKDYMNTSKFTISR